MFLSSSEKDTTNGRIAFVSPPTQRVGSIALAQQPLEAVLLRLEEQDRLAKRQQLFLVQLFHQRLANFTQRRTLSINVAGRIDAIDPDFGVGSLPSSERGRGQWVYTQDKRGQITSGQRIWRADSMVEGTLPPRVSYTYDELGNRLTSTAYKDIGTTTADATTYTINDLNQYASRTNARGLIISGMAPQDQPVMLTVKTDLNLATPNTALNNQPAERQGTLFARRIAFTSTAEWAKIDINATGGDPSRTARTLGNRWVPPQTEAMTYDADGNLTGDARWIYRWDGEGRLSELETKATAGAVGLPMVKLVFGYDAGSRRVMKRVYANLGGTTTAPNWVLQNDVRFVYVGWHMIAEVEIKGTASDAPAGGGANPPPFLRRSWLWGEDLTGTAPAAVGDQRKLGAGGGVGGLLAVTRHARGDQPAESYWATSDLNGNVIGLLATSSTKTAVYDYDPFGQPIRVNEPEAGLNPVRFSSKYTDAETGLCYYGYRYYSPEVGRWLGRDPIGERGGLNLYGMLGNDPVGKVDVLGKNQVVVKTSRMRELGVRGMYQVKFTFSLAEPDPVGGYLVQKIKNTLEIDGERKKIEVYYEAWEVKPGQREPSANVRGYTDASVGVTREGTCGKSRQDGVVRFYRRGMTGDLGSQDMVEDPGAADGSGLSARISPPQPGTGFEIGGVDGAGLLPSTWARPDWWTNMPIGSARRSVTAWWSCGGGARSSTNLKILPQ